MQNGLFVPSESDVKKCEEGKGCDYGICDECIKTNREGSWNGSIINWFKRSI